MSSPAPKVLLCDLDGTLIDTMPTLADLASEVMADVYAMDPVEARKAYITTCGRPFIHQLGVIFPGDARNQGASDRFEGAKPARCAAARMSPDTARALGVLRKRGIRIAVSSNNGNENVQAFAQRAAFEFDLLLGFGGGLAKGKTHIEAACRQFEIGRDELLFVGDSLHDGDIAAAEQIGFVGLTGTFSREQFVQRFGGRYPIVDRFADLVDLFRASAAA